MQLGPPGVDDGSATFCTLLLTSERVLMTYTAGDPQRAAYEASPWLVQLMLASARHKALKAPAPVDVSKRRIDYRLVSPPAPVATHRLPATASASALEDLIVCPYRFFALRVLGLARMDALSEQLDRSDYGQMAHRLLAWLHREFPALMDLDDATVIDQAQQILSQQRGSSPMEKTQRAAFSAMITRWLPEYLQWAHAREKGGWKVAGTEVPVSGVLPLVDGPMHVQGRIDRLELHSSGDAAIYDYKAQGKQTVSQLAREPLEAPQLALYGAMLDRPVTELGYVSLSADRAEQIAIKESASELIETVRQAVINLLGEVNRGTPLPANGTSSACARCDAYGLCQRGYRP
jgi:ATP-dependent helicase/nuclease subunit B